MKNLLLVLAAGSALMFTGCKEDNDDAVPTYDIIGAWHPTKVVITDVGNGVSNSTSQDYTLCQQEGRWNFNDNATGSIVTNDQVSGACEVMSNQNFSYNYDKNNRTITMNYQNLYMKSGRVAFGNAQTMNVTIESTVNGVYHSETVTLKKVTN